MRELLFFFYIYGFNKVSYGGCLLYMVYFCGAIIACLMSFSNIIMRLLFSFSDDE